jgi:membrane-associated phospholipid phosphatase
LLRSNLCSSLLLGILLSSATAWADQPVTDDGSAGEGAVSDALPGALAPRVVAPAAPPTSAELQERDAARDEVRWRWQEFGFGNFIATGLGLTAAFGSLALPVDQQRWTSENSFDAAVRDAVVPNSIEGRERARDVSDIALVAQGNQILFDTLVVAWWHHHSAEVAWQMALINVETIALNVGINGLITGFASRERPYRGRCGPDFDSDPLDDCRSSKRYRSFYSGHTSTTFAMAGLTCMHHAYLPLYGGGWADTAICPVSFLVAGLTGSMRVLGDQHWASDVMVGAGMGTLIGLGVPWLFHYRIDSLPDVTGDSSLRMQLMPTPQGAQLMGQF